MKRYSVLTGFNRGGTSALMSAIRQAGIPIVGFKYPWEFDFEDKKTKKQVKRDGGLASLSSLCLDHVINRNPTGFWEISSICLRKGLQKEHEELGENNDIIKVPFNVLPSSDPTLVNKVIVILRHPASILASQYKLKKPKIDKEIWTKTVSLTLLYNAVLSLKWIKTHRKKKLIVYYEDLIKNPEDVLFDVCWFLEQGNEEAGAKVINKKLNRSIPFKSECEELKEAIKFYKNPTIKYDTQEIAKRIKKLDKKGEMVDVKKLK